MDQMAQRPGKSSRGPLADPTAAYMPDLSYSSGARHTGSAARPTRSSICEEASTIRGQAISARSCQHIHLFIFLPLP